MSIPTFEEQGAGQPVDSTVNTVATEVALNGHEAPMSPISNPSVQDLPMHLTQTSKSAPLNTSLVVANDTSNPKFCGVCKEQPYKYKCVRCLMPYCSMVCSTLHKATHPSIPSPAPAPAPEPKIETPKTAARAGTIAAAGQAGPFAALDNSTELQALFRHYPQLRLQLNAVYEAMQPPNDNTPDMYEKLTGKHNHQKAWNQDRGLDNGRKALDRARQVWGKDGEGVREYGELILRIVEGVDSEEMVRRELDRENARAVKALLDGEL